MNIVQVVHIGGVGTRYTFKVPEGIRLEKGQMVQVKDKHGYHMCECVTDSYDLDEYAIDMIMNGKKVTAAVTGVYSLTKFYDMGEADKKL